MGKKRNGTAYIEFGELSGSDARTTKMWELSVIQGVVSPTYVIRTPIPRC